MQSLRSGSIATPFSSVTIFPNFAQLSDNLKQSFTSHLVPLTLTLGAISLIARVELSVSTRSQGSAFDFAASLASWSRHWRWVVERFRCIPVSTEGLERHEYRHLTILDR